ncbi:substrate-binding domain-containing protein [Rhodococcus pseudokoreensis]|uniref:Substrate-binding domain-containing protein n=1 Tax=Rhodococcus pseudokoreensis TaxID=2811421 RepID=A0A974W6X7_9NOCA|nr:substrate-binding domain-containing protein [Rhodococcus pseudokoreensis]QSE92325.1 substrate-binding domain-containing protein [Rhodococcus pseudokoreensis]
MSSHRKWTGVGAVLLAVGMIAGCTVNTGAEAGTGGERGDGQGFGANVELLPARQKVQDIMQGKRVAFVPMLYKGYQLTENWGTSLTRSLEASGAQVTIHDPNFDPDRMLAILNDIIARKQADVLVLQSSAQGLLDNVIERAAQAGIYTVVLNMMSTRLSDAFVGVDVYGAAQAITKRAVADCNARGTTKKLSIIDGMGNDPASLLWNAGIKDVAEHEGYEVQISHSQFDNSKAQAAAEAAMQQNGNDLCGFLVTFDLNAVSVGQSVKAAESRGQIQPAAIGVYTLDANSATCEELKRGTVTATAAYDVQGIGAAGAVAVQNLLINGAPAGSRHDVGYVSYHVVDGKTADETTIACYRSN